MLVCVIESTLPTQINGAERHMRHVWNLFSGRADIEGGMMLPTETKEVLDS